MALTERPLAACCASGGVVSPKRAYLALSVIGFVLPYSQFLPWTFKYGLDPTQFLGDLFANRIGGFFGFDVLVSGTALFVFMAYDEQRDSVRNAWIAMIGTVSVGVSFGLPMYLYLREASRERQRAVPAARN
jgi:hypothetical protein